MKKELEIKIINLYGSAEFPREIEVKKPKLKRIKTRTRTSNKLGNLAQETQTEEENTETMIEKVNSFKWVNELPVVRLGGSHGKLWGLLREAGKICALEGNTIIKSKTEVETLMPVIQILPEFAPLKTKGKIETKGGLVGVNSMFGGKSTQKPTTWDIIPESQTKITLIYPEKFNGHVEAMLNMAQQMNFAERRRAQFTILDKN